ncbi:thermonuclease family protein [Propionibacteriaceae bacterium Y1700]|uniref:thermonuclease family protein n=1 Tax=Microlunatus sp. Y1700 TaxID=3418487 RepID=UPI003DA75EEC
MGDASVMQVDHEFSGEPVSTWGARVSAVMAAACLLLVSGCDEGMAVRGAVGAAGVAAHKDAMEDSATIVRVIDGDTVLVTVDDQLTRVRLLNVDTPETKHPGEPVQCMGEEAAAFLTDRLPAGTEVSLQYDLKRTDRYGRVLAGVVEGDSLINAEIAGRGLGVAVLFEPNRRFLAEVEAAEQSARQKEFGLFGADVQCTLPAQTTAMNNQLATLSQEQPTTSAAAAAAAAAASTLLVDADRLHHSLLNGSLVHGAAVIAAYDRDLRRSLAYSLQSSINTAKAEQQRLDKLAKALKAEEKRKAEAKRRAEERRKAEEARAAEQRRAAEARRTQAEQQRRSANTSPNRPTAPEKSTPRKKAPKESSGSSDNPYPGYTGPRCYAPGGKTWRPC